MPARTLPSADAPGAAYLGLDVGTHALKAVGLVVPADGGAPVTTHAAAVVYDAELPAYAPAVARDAATGTADVDPRLFAAALDAALEKLRREGFAVADVRSVSGSAQQHGSVYATAMLRERLSALDPKYPLDAPENLPEDCFAFPRAPIWMDASTSHECALLEEALGGPARLAAVTGSRAYERFTAAQIAKRRSRDPSRFARTERILLISSFMASLLAGVLAPEDVGDASGMNLADLTVEPVRWWDDGVRVAGAADKLSPSPVPGWTVVGPIAEYFHTKFGIPREAHVVVWSGDNPNTIAGYGGLEEGDLLVSLGTSDTAQWITLDGRGAPFGHTFRSTLSKDPQYFRMLCFANGSQTREAVRDGRYTCSNVGAAESRNARTWDEFDAAVAAVPPGCSPPRIALCHSVPEIVPRSDSDKHARVFSIQDAKIRPESAGAPWGELCRLVVESRALAIATLSAELESAAGTHSPPKFRRILLAGGGSASKVFPQILADVLGLPVLAYTLSASAAVGAGLRAHHAEQVAVAGDFVPFSAKREREEDGGSGRSEQSGSDLRLLAEPRKEVTAMYSKLHIPCFHALVGQEESAS